MTLQQQLDDAKVQYHLLVTGQKATVYVDQNGERVEYTATTAARLRQYIQELEKTIAGKATHCGALTGFF